MCDLHEAASLLRPRPGDFPGFARKPQVLKRGDGQIAVFIGTAYQDLTLGQALNLRDRLTVAIDSTRAATAHGAKP